MRLSGIDLNLLVVLDALLAERSVTRAARRLGLSQSATSHALGRLRALLDDPLFVRGREGVTPTDRALSLGPQVRALLTLAEATLRPDARFEPASASLHFTLALDDATQAALVPGLFAALHRRAPGITLRVVHEPEDRLADALEAGRVDAVVTVPNRGLAGLPQRTLLRYRHVGICRDRAVLPARPTLARFAQARQVAIATQVSVDPEVDRQLRAHGLARTVHLTVSSPAAVPAIVASTDLVAIVPDRLVESSPLGRRLTRFSPPLPLGDVDVALVHHPRTEHDPARAFVRSLVERRFVGAGSRRA